MKLLPIVADRLEVFFSFLPFELRQIHTTGIQLHNLWYNHDDLAPFIGRSEYHEVHYDPRDVTCVYVRGPKGRVLVVRCTVPGIKQISLYELNDLRRRRQAVADDPAQAALRDAGVVAKDELVLKSKKATRAAHRKSARDQERRDAAKETAARLGHPQAPDAQIDEAAFDPSTPLVTFTVEQIQLPGKPGTGASHV